MKLLEPAGGKRLSSSSKRFERQNATCLRGRLGLAANSGAGMLDAGARSGIFFFGLHIPMSHVVLYWERACARKNLSEVVVCATIPAERRKHPPSFTAVLACLKHPKNCWGRPGAC